VTRGAGTDRLDDVDDQAAPGLVDPILPDSGGPDGRCGTETLDDATPEGTGRFCSSTASTIQRWSAKTTASPSGAVPTSPSVEAKLSTIGAPNTSRIIVRAGVELVITVGMGSSPRKWGDSPFCR
jgi:hypothetical protein